MKNIFYILLILLLVSCGGKTKMQKSTDYYEESIELKLDTIYETDEYLIMDGEPVEYLMMEDESPILEESPKPIMHSNNQPDGTLLYRIDSVFIIDVTTMVEARIIRKIYEEVPVNIVQLFQETSTGKVLIETIKTSEIMDVNLISLEPDAFQINKISSDNQYLDSNILAEWFWGVTPKKVGNYSLILKVTIKTNGVNKDKVIFNKNINVKNKPKRKFHIYIEKPESLKNLSKNEISCIINKTSEDNYDFEWGGNGKILIELDNQTEFNIVSDNIIIDDDKNLFINKWTIIPDTKLKYVNFKIKILGDNEQIYVYKDTLIIKKDFFQSFNKFIDNTLKRWYWLLSTLLIPLVMWIKKKYFKKENKDNVS